MSELDETQIHNYELLISTEFLEVWGQPTDNVADRVQRALQVTEKADELLSPDQKVALAYTIKSLMQGSYNELAIGLGVKMIGRITARINEIIKSKGESGPAFIELHREVLQELHCYNELSQNSDELIPAEIEIVQIKAAVLKLLRSMVEERKHLIETSTELEQNKKELALALKKGEIDDKFDGLKDELRGESEFEDTLQKMLHLLQEELNLKGAAIFYKEPLKNGVGFDDDNLPEPDVGNRKMSLTKEITEGNVRKALSATQKDLEGGMDYVPYKQEGLESTDTYWVMPIEVSKSDRKLGQLILVTEGEENDVREDFDELFRFVESRVDSIVDEGMKKLCATRLAIECNEISTRTNVSKLPGAYRKYISLLQRITGLDISFVYNDMIRKEEAKGFKVTQDGIEFIDTDDVQQNFISELGKEGPWGENGFYVSLFDNRGDLINELAREQGEQTGEYDSLCAGTIIVEGTKSITAEQKDLLRIVSQILHQDLLTRIGEFERLITGAGRGVSARAMEGDLELEGARPAAVCFVDIVGSTPLCEEVGDQVYSDGLNDWYVDLSDIEIKKIMAGLLDKYLGDGAFMAAGPPYSPDGSNYAHETIYDEGHLVTNILHNRWRAEQSLKKAFEGKVEKPPKLNTGVAYAEKAKIRFLGRRRAGGNSREVNRSEYTIIGDAVHIAARLESEAVNGETLLPISSYIKHRKYVEREKKADKWNDSVKDHVEIGMPFITFLKGLSDPVEVVRVIPSEEAEKLQQERQQIFADKSGLEIAFKSASEIPDGEYIMDGDYVIEEDDPDIDDDASQCIINIEYGDDTFEAQVSLKDLPEPITKWVSIDEYQKILDGEKPSRILRVDDGELFIINYECAEYKQVGAIQEMLAKNKKQRIKTVHYRKMISGDYSIASYEEEDECYIFELERLGEEFTAIIPKDRFLTEVGEPKILVCSKKKFLCEDEGVPAWSDLPIPAAA